MQFAAFSNLKSIDPSRRHANDSSWLRIIAIPTTLSAAELTWYAGVTDAEHGIKRVLGDPMLVPRAVLYDPALTLPVRLPVLLASGIKAIDHAAERLAVPQAQPFCDAVSTHALQMLSEALPRIAQSPEDLAPRLECQLAAWLSISGGASGVGVGASHAIGHMLGAHTGMAHGLTSCVMLASVMRWNKPVNAGRQALISQAMGCPGVDAAGVIEDLVRSLDLPYRLRDVGVSQRELPDIAHKTMEDASIRRNPRPIHGASDVLEILRMAY